MAGARVLRTAAGILSGNYPCFAPPGALAEHLRRLARAFRWLGTHHAQNAPNIKPQRSSIP